MFIRAKFKLEARQSLQGHGAAAVWVTFLFLLTPLILNMPNLLDHQLTWTAGEWLFLAIVTGPLLLARAHYFLAIVKGVKQDSVKHFYAAFTEAVKALAAFLWAALLIILWSFLLVIPGIVKALAYSQQYFILADNPQISATRALQLSERMTRGYKWELFMTRCSFIGWDILVLLTWGIGSLAVIPYRQTTLAEMYLFMRDESIRKGLCSKDEFFLPEEQSAEQVAAEEGSNFDGEQ